MPPRKVPEASSSLINRKDKQEKRKNKVRERK
jgi:hypothetical protein